MGARHVAGPAPGLSCRVSDRRGGTGRGLRLGRATGRRRHHRQCHGPRRVPRVRPSDDARARPGRRAAGNARTSVTDPEVVLLQERGDAHERAYLERLRAEGRTVHIGTKDGLTPRIALAPPRRTRSPRCGAASTSSTRPRCSTAAGAATPTSCSSVDGPVRSRRLALRGRRHQAGPVGEGLGAAPGLRVLGPPGRRSRAGGRSTSTS